MIIYVIIYTKNVIIFGADNKSSYHAENCRNNLFSSRWMSAEKKCNKYKFLLAWVYTIMLTIVIYLLTDNKSLILKTTIKMLVFKLSFI